MLVLPIAYQGPHPQHALLQLSSTAEVEVPRFMSDELESENGKTPVLVAMADTRAPEVLTPGSTVQHWTNNFLKTARASLKGDFDFRYFKCLHKSNSKPTEKEEAFWCKAVALNHIARTTRYQFVVMLDTDAHVDHAFKGMMDKVFETLSSRNFLVEDRCQQQGSHGSCNFKDRPLANVSIITPVAPVSDATVAGVPNKHCTCVMLIRMDTQGKFLLQSWLRRYPDVKELRMWDKTYKGLHDQLGFNMVAQKYPDWAEAIHADLFSDGYSERTNLSSTAYVRNSQIFKDSLGRPATGLFKHDRKKGPADQIKTDMGAFLAAHWRDAPNLVSEVYYDDYLSQSE